MCDLCDKAHEDFKNYVESAIPVSGREVAERASQGASMSEPNNVRTRLRERATCQLARCEKMAHWMVESPRAVVLAEADEWRLVLALLDASEQQHVEHCPKEGHAR